MRCLSIRPKKTIISFLFLFIIILSTIQIDGVNSSNIDRSINKNYGIEEKLLETKLRILMRMNDLPSLSTAIIKDNQVVWTKAIGESCTFPSKKTSSDTIYLISSITKAFLATALMQLYEQGIYDLDENINKYLPFNLTHPYFDYPDINITFRHLLSHRSGIYDYAIYERAGMMRNFNELPFFPENISTWLKERLVPGEEKYSPNFWMKDNSPGGNAYYSNIGYLVLSCAFEKLSGKKVETYVQDHIFEPLEMFNTSYHPQSLNKKQMATLYHDKKIGIYMPLPQYDYRGFAPMCGIRTSVNDLSHYLIAHMNQGVYKDKRILKNDTIHLMHNTIYSRYGGVFDEVWNRHITYGLGWSSQTMYGTRTYGHNGISPGAAAMMQIDMENNIGIIIQTNKFNILKFNRLIQFSQAREILFVMAHVLFKFAYLHVTDY